MFRFSGVVLLLTLLLLAPSATTAAPNIRLTNDPAASVKPQVAFDPQGNLIVVWEDSRFGNPEILWQRFTPLGSPLTDPARLTTTATAPYPTNPDVSCDPSGISHVCWQVGSDSQRGRGQMFLCRVALDGSKTLGNMPVYGTDAVRPRIASTSDGQTYLAWYQYDNFSNYVRLERFSATGSPACSLTYRLTFGTGIQKRPVVAATSTSGAVLYWYDYTQFLDRVVTRGVATLPCLPTSGSSVASGVNDDVTLSADASGSMEAVAYTNGGDIYLRVNPSPACRASSGTHTASLPAVGVDGTHSYLTWQDSRAGNSEIYFAKMSACTSLTGDIRLTNDVASSSTPDIAVSKDGADRWVVVWQDTRDGNSEIYITSGDNPIVTAPPVVVAAEGISTQFTISASDPEGEPITTLDATGLPPCASMMKAPDNSSATITVTPTMQDIGDYMVTFTATNNLAGTALTRISIRPKYDIGDASLSGNIFRLGDNATLAFTLRNNTPTGGAVTAIVDEVEGPLSSTAVYPVSSDVVPLAARDSTALQHSFNIIGIPTGSMLPYHLRIRILGPDGNTYGADYNIEFGTTSLTNEAIQALAAEFNVCAAASPPGDTFLSYYPCIGDFLGIYGVTGFMLGQAAARQGVIDASCRAAQFAAAGKTCERNVALILAGTGVFSMGVKAAVLAQVATPVLIYTDVVLKAVKCGLNIVSHGQIESWICDHVSATQAASITGIGSGSKARALLDDVSSVSDSLGIPFAAHIAVEGGARPRLDMGAGWVTPESTSVDDAVGWALAPDTLSWFSVGPYVTSLGTRNDSMTVTPRPVEPLTVTLAATRSGDVFVGGAVRSVGSTTTQRIDHGPVFVAAGAVLCAWFSNGFPLLIDWEGDGTWDQVRYPNGTVLTGADAVSHTGTLRPWLRASPNPAGDGMTLDFGPATGPSRHTVKIFDARGSLVRALVASPASGSVVRLHWDGRDQNGTRVAQGIYFARYEAGKVQVTRKLVVVR